ncbi:MAG: MotA/TolQ/ExbB proton channel family protein [Flavobacteriales bacterium]|nr:MotA/TolQ/ExbB proton channel family protein [Bacteroidota bacterium]MCB9241752.1 MotA/TolQ/ExbB proton channel family protein [Flavobacteriales bacterium]
MQNILLQVTDVVATDSTGLHIESQESLSVLDLALKGGWMLLPIVILSIIAVYLLIERYLTIKKARHYDPVFMARIKDMVKDGNIKGAQSLCETTNTPVARMLEKGLSRIGKPLDDISVAVQNVGNLEVSKLEKGMPLLATISGAAPMLGFLGTVTGMIKTFYTLAQNAEGIDIGSFSGGIYEAMVTTVGGLIVGIFAYISYNSLTAMIDKVIYRMEATSMEFLDILHEPA